MPAFLVSWIVSIALSLLKSYGIPVVIEALKGLEVKYPGMAPLIEEVISFLASLKNNPQAEPSEALKAAAFAHKKACSGVACPPELVN